MGEHDAATFDVHFQCNLCVLHKGEYGTDTLELPFRATRCVLDMGEYGSVTFDVQHQCTTTRVTTHAGLSPPRFISAQNFASLTRVNTVQTPLMRNSSVTCATYTRVTTVRTQAWPHGALPPDRSPDAVSLHRDDPGTTRGDIKRNESSNERSAR